jgi:hypothetical protein
MTTEPSLQTDPPFDAFDNLVYCFDAQTGEAIIKARLLSGYERYELDLNQLSNAYVTAVLSVPESSHHQALGKALRAVMAERMDNELRNGHDGGHAAFTITNHFMAIADTTAQVMVAQDDKALTGGDEIIEAITEMEERPLERFISHYEGMENIDEGKGEYPDYRFNFRLLNNELISLTIDELTQRHKTTLLFLDLNAADEELPQDSQAAHAVLNCTFELDELEKAQDDLALRQPGMLPELKAPSYIREYMCGYYEGDEGTHAIGAAFLDEDEDQLVLTVEQMQTRLRLGLQALHNGETESPEDTVKLRHEINTLDQAFKELGFATTLPAALPVRDMSSQAALKEVAQYYQLLSTACDITETGEKNYTATLQIGPRPEQTETLTQSQIEYELDRIPHQLAQEDQPLLRHRHTILLLALADLHTLRLEYGEPLSTPNYIVPELSAITVVTNDEEYPTVVDTLLINDLDEQNSAMVRPITCFMELVQGTGLNAGQPVARLVNALDQEVELNQQDVQSLLEAYDQMADLAKYHFIETDMPLYKIQRDTMKDEYCHLQLAATELAVDQHCKALLSEIEDDHTLLRLSANKASAHLTKDIVVQRQDLAPAVHQAFGQAGRVLQHAAHKAVRPIRFQPPHKG